MLSSFGKANHALAAAALVLRGFAASYTLCEVEKRHLPTLIACRLACSATLGAFSYAQDPTNKYLLLHAEPCWKALELFWALPRETVSGFFDLAINGEADNVSDIFLPDPTTPDFFSSVRSKRASLKRGRDEITFVTGNANKLKEVKRCVR